MIRKLKRAVLAAKWALTHADDLTMLRHELIQDSLERNSRGNMPRVAAKGHWYFTRYLWDLPIR